MISAAGHRAFFSVIQGMGRAPCCDKANVKRGPWSPEEDAALRSYLEIHGTAGNWIALPKKAGLSSSLPRLAQFSPFSVFYSSYSYMPSDRSQTVMSRNAVCFSP